MCSRLPIKSVVSPLNFLQFIPIKGRACESFFTKRCSLNLFRFQLQRFCTVTTNLNVPFRTHTCGELQAKHIGQEVTLCGWINTRRFDKFIVLQDGYGRLQILLEQCNPSMVKYLASLPLESVIQVKGVLQRRPSGQINRQLPLGEFEVVLKEAKLLGASSSNIPYTAKDLDKVGDVPKLQYRYLYLRNPEIQKNLRERSRILMKMREFMCYERDFVEVETPTLFRKSPGGAKEFLVVSEFPGKFYALTQSPQQFKQMLMVSYFDKYFQIARCYRNEGTKSDRQPEFTQLDIEASFITAESIKSLVEGLLEYSWPKEKPKLCLPFPSMTYKDAVHQYGCDKPDIRYEMKLHYLTEELVGQGIDIFDRCLTGINSVVAAIVIPSGSKHITNSQLRDLKEKAKLSFQNLLDIKVKKDLTWNSVMAKHVSPDLLCKVNSILDVKPQDLVILAAGKYDDVVQLLGKTRVNCAQYLESAGVEIFKPNDFRFLWVEDFPLFLEKDGQLESAHHPFTAPHPSHIDLVHTNPCEARGQHYDLVLNGQEIGGGSIRINDSNMQRYILEEVLKVDVNAFQHLLDALESGCPPHGGIALGIDRLLAIICGCKSIADVIAFPKSRDGKDLLSGAPAPLSETEASEITNFTSLK